MCKDNTDLSIVEITLVKYHRNYQQDIRAFFHKMIRLILLLELFAAEWVKVHDKILGRLPLELLSALHHEHFYIRDIALSELKIVVEYVEHDQHLEDGYE